jgi:glutamate dehydrogenase (NAD(P)+)
MGEPSSARPYLIATDYLVNSGGVIFAAQERLIRTPDHLRIPPKMLGDRVAVEAWLTEHAGDLAELARRRLEAGEAWRDQVIRRNMRELVERLVSDADMLPCEAAESIAIERIATSESGRKAAEIMAPIPTTRSDGRVQQAAALLVEAACPILAVVSAEGTFVGVVTDWDITRPPPWAARRRDGRFDHDPGGRHRRARREHPRGGPQAGILRDLGSPRG